MLKIPMYLMSVALNPQQIVSLLVKLSAKLDGQSHLLELLIDASQDVISFDLTSQSLVVVKGGEEHHYSLTQDHFMQTNKHGAMISGDYLMAITYVAFINYRSEQLYLFKIRQELTQFTEPYTSKLEDVDGMKLLRIPSLFAQSGGFFVVSINGNKVLWE